MLKTPQFLRALLQETKKVEAMFKVTFSREEWTPFLFSMTQAHVEGIGLTEPPCHGHVVSGELKPEVGFCWFFFSDPLEWGFKLTPLTTLCSVAAGTSNPSGGS